MKTISEKLLEMFERDANQSYITLLNAKKQYERALSQSEKADKRYEGLAIKMGLLEAPKEGKPS